MHQAAADLALELDFTRSHILLSSVQEITSLLFRINEREHTFVYFSFTLPAEPIGTLWTRR